HATHEHSANHSKRLQKIAARREASSTSDDNLLSYVRQKVVATPSLAFLDFHLFEDRIHGHRRVVRTRGDAGEDAPGQVLKSLRGDFRPALLILRIQA